LPIDLLQVIQSVKETAYFLKSEAMKKRLLNAKNAFSPVVATTKKADAATLGLHC